MAILRPDTTTTLNGVKINEYLLTKHNPNHINMPSVSMESKVIGVTVHNTDWISVASGTTPAEQYTRATVNGNMKDVRVHYYVDDVCAWQNLPLSLSGWHAADGSGNGNRRTVSIECIMSSAYNSTDKKSEDNCARLAAALLKKYGLDINGKQVYPAPKSYVRGTKIELENTPLYISASASNSTKKSGIYYIYDGEAVNGRYRITTKPEYCGKTPVGKYVSGWVNKNSI